MGIMKTPMNGNLAKKAAFIGRATATLLSPLPDSPKSAQLLALGNLAKAPKQPSLAQLEEPCQQASLTSIDLLVAGTDCDLDSLLETVGQLREIHPGLKVVLVDSASAPVLPSPPPCVDSVIPVSAAMAEAGRCLLSQQAGILAGNNAGMAAYVAFVMGAKMEAWQTIAIATTNISPQLLGL